jgi:imidazolonepropionase-like amidohydrolase
VTRALFSDVMIFDGSGSDLFPGSVLVEGNRIAAVVPEGEGFDSDDAQTIEGKGRTLMPGMVEAHAHLTWPSSIDRVINAMKVPLDEHVAVTENNARITLDAGFTSAYSAGSLGEKIEPALRDRINACDIPGPRLRASALEKGAEGVMGVPEGHDPTHDRDITGLIAYVKSMKAQGCDTIKFLMSSDDAFQRGGAQTLMYSEEEAQAIGKAAADEGIWLACHAQAAEAVKRAVRAGFRAIFHCTHADEEALDLLEAYKDRHFVAPAPGLLYARCYEAQSFGIGPEEAVAIGARGGLDAMIRLMPEMKRRGIRVLPGGDYGFPYNVIGRNARDLQIFVEHFGFSPAETLVAATRQGGELMDMDVGQVKAGMLADLLLVDGDPLADIRILQDKHKIPVVMKDGAFHRNALHPVRA